MQSTPILGVGVFVTWAKTRGLAQNPYLVVSMLYACQQRAAFEHFGRRVINN